MSGDGLDRATAPRSRSGQTSSDRSAASRSPARCGWSASSALGSRGFRSTCTPSTRPRGSRAPSSRRATARRSQDRIRAVVRGRGPGLRAAARRRLQHAPRARAGGGRARGGTAPRLPRPRHGRLLGRGRSISRSGRRWRSSRAASGMSDEGIARALDDRAWAPVGRCLDRSRAGRRRHRRAGVRDRLARARRRGAAARGARPGDRAGARGRGRAAVEAAASARRPRRFRPPPRRSA